MPEQLSSMMHADRVGIPVSRQEALSMSRQMIEKAERERSGGTEMGCWVESAERTPDMIGAEIWVVVIEELQLLHRGRCAEMAEYLGEGYFNLIERGDEAVFGDEIDWWMLLERPGLPIRSGEAAPCPSK